jgi:hypothetical protein
MKNKIKRGNNMIEYKMEQCETCKSESKIEEKNKGRKNNLFYKHAV